MLLFRKKITISNQRKIFLVLTFMSLSIGVWSNYRQIWMIDNNFSVSDVSYLISLGMFGSCFLSIIVSLFSTKVKIKELMVLTFSMSIIAQLGLLFTYKSGSQTQIETLMLLTVLAENLYWIGIYPLFTTVGKSDEVFNNKVIVQNLFKDLGLLVSGLVIGKSISYFVLDSNFCLLLSIIFSLIALYFLLLIRYEKDPQNKIVVKDFSTAFKILFRNKVFILYFIYSFFVNAAWDMIIGLQLLLFTTGFNVIESKSSLIIIFIGMIATVLAIFTKKVKLKNNFNASLIKYLSRIIMYLLVFFTKNIYVALIAFAVTILTSRILSNNTDGVYINSADDDLQLLLSNFRFILIFLGETFGLFLAGLLFNYGFDILFLASGILYMFVLLTCYLLNRYK